MNGTIPQADPALMQVMLSNAAEALSNPVGRQELLQWLETHADGPGVRCDCNEIAGSMVLCLQDKMASVRTLGEGVLTSLISKGLINRLAIDKATRDLAPATKRALQAPLERMLASFGTKSLSATAGSTAEDEPRAAVAVVVEEVAAPVKSVLVKKAAAVVEHAAPVATAAEVVTEDDISFPLKKTNKNKRNDEFYKQNWPLPPEDIGEAEMATLRREWETQVNNGDMTLLLFPQSKFGASSQENYMGAATELLSMLQQPAGSPNSSIALMHTDFILRWATYVLCVRETAQGTLKVLQVISAVFELHRALGVPLHEAEAGIVLPQLIERSGHKSERHKAAYKAALEVAEAVCPPAKMSAFLLQGFNCKNKKTRAVCLEELEQVVTVHGYAPLGKAGLREVTIQLDSSDVGVRNAALDLVYAIYIHAGADTAKLYKLLGGDVTDKAKSLIAGRIKEKGKHAANQPPPAPTASQLHASEAIGRAANPSPVRERAPAVKPAVVAEAPPAGSGFVMRGGANVAATYSAYDNAGAGSLAFKLDMTPPGHSEYASTQEGKGNTSRTPAANDVKVSLFGHVTPEPAADVVDISNVYAEIASKVNRMTTLYSEFLSQQRDRTSPHISRDLITACDDCREYMKMLHALVTGGWAKGGSVNSATAAKDDAVLLQNAEGLVVMIVTCLSLAFEGIGVSARSTADMPVASALDADVSLVSVCLASLHALVKHAGVVQKLSENALVELLSDSVLAISHEKITGTNSAPDVKEACEQMHRVLLLIMARTAQEAGTARMVSAVMQSLFQCIEEVDHASVGKSTVTRRLLPRRCSKPLSKLLLKVLSDECRQARPFVSLPAGDVSLMLGSLHRFFSGHPAEVTKDDTPFCAAKTVLAQLVKSVGAASILMTLQESLNIPPASFVCRLTAKLGHGDAVPKASAGEEVHASVSGDDLNGLSNVSPELHATLVSIIDELTNSRDKIGTIRKLYFLIQSNPSLDVSYYLQRTSSVFRKYVLDTLQQMDEQKAKSAGRAQLSASTTANDTENLSSSSSMAGARSGPDTTSGNEGFEAMRIIEGLKKSQANSDSTPK